jgi:GT2 family glycosyltransferase
MNIRVPSAPNPSRAAGRPTTPARRAAGRRSTPAPTPVVPSTPACGPRAAAEPVSVILPCEAGDLVMAEPVVGELRRLGHPVRFHAAPRFRDLVESFGAAWYPYDDWRTAPQPVNLVRRIEEFNHRAKDPVHGTDLFLRVASLDPERRAARLPADWPVRPAGLLPAGTENPVAVFPFSSLRGLRSLDPAVLPGLCEELRSRGMTPVLLDGRPWPTALPAGTVDLTGRTATLREAAGVMRACIGALVTDSAAMHLAGALGVRAVALMTALPAISRTAYYETVLPFEIDLPCAPCMAHPSCPMRDLACARPNAATLADAAAAYLLGRRPARGNGGGGNRPITVLVLSRNTRDVTRRCLETFLPTLVYDRHVRRVRVVDNGSGDGSAEMLLAFAGVPKVELELRPDNPGIHRSWNRIALASRDDLLILGSDTEALSANWLTALRRHVASHPRTGLVATRQVKPLAGRWLITFGGTGDEGGPPHRVGWVDHGDWGRPTKHAWVTHSSVLVRREVFDAVGGYDERYQVYSGDDEFGRRATAAGWECWYTPYATVLHWGGKSVAAARARGEITPEMIAQDRALHGRRVAEIAEGRTIRAGADGTH